jgi:putative transposase
MRTDNGYRKLCKRYDECGTGHYLTFSCFHNQPFLKAERTCQWLVNAINAARKKYPFDLWAWVFMPTHVHLLVYPHEGTGISEILAGIKKPVGKLAGLFVRANASEFIPQMSDRQPDGTVILRFWQPGGGYDRNIFSLEELHEKIQYIHNNPIRSDLVPEPQKWIWSSYHAWENGTDEPLRIDRDSLPDLNQR